MSAGDCDDADPCTTDDCLETGQCTHSTSTPDSDGDGHHAPLPGTVAGEPGSCGDDCDDANAAMFPGNSEVCDGVDNDCNGGVDDGATFVPSVAGPVRVSDDVAPALVGGLAFDGETYLSVYAGDTQGFSMYETRLDVAGNKLEPTEVAVHLTDSDSSGGPLLWLGDRYGLAWQDRRDGDYEVYYAELDALGAKLIADVRLTNALGFSVNVAMARSGAELITVWQDERAGHFDVMAQRVGLGGVPLGDNVSLTADENDDAEAPAVAVGAAGVGVAWTIHNVSSQAVHFRVFHPETLAGQSPVVALTDGSTQARNPRVAWNQDHFMVAWYDPGAPVAAIYGATLSPDGEIIVPPTALTAPGASNSRYPWLMPLGDRTLVLFSDDRDQNDGYELYARTVGTNLAPIGPAQRLTTAIDDSVYPVATFGPNGDVGILFRDDRYQGEQHVWFTQLGCSLAGQ